MSFLDEFEDLRIFTEGEFSDVALVTSGTAINSQISGLFDNFSEEIFSDLSAAEGRKIVFRVESNKIQGLSHYDRLAIKGQNYQVIGINPNDDHRLTELQLKETAFISPSTGEEITDSVGIGQPVGEAILSYRLVCRQEDDLLYLADARNIERVRVIGMIEKSVPSGGVESVKYAGYIKNSSWNFTPSKGLFLGSQGNLIQMPLSDAVAQIDVGTVLSPTEILLDICDPIFL